MKIIPPLVALAATLVVVATGCGGESSAEEQWADSVCTDVATWQDELQQAEDEIRTALQSPGTETLGAIDTAIRQAAEATHELSDELKALEAPDTASGAEAKRQLDALATQLESTATKTSLLLSLKCNPPPQLRRRPWRPSKQAGATWRKASRTLARATSSGPTDAYRTRQRPTLAPANCSRRSCGQSCWC